MREGIPPVRLQGNILVHGGNSMVTKLHTISIDLMASKVTQNQYEVEIHGRNK